jgi:chitinase
VVGGEVQKACNSHYYEQGIIHLAHAAGAEVYPSLGGWTLSDPFPAMAASAEARANFAENCVKLIQDYDFDGIDIDWEYPGKLTANKKTYI